MRLLLSLIVLLVGACTTDEPGITIPDDKLVEFYASAEAQLKAQGRMRTETAPRDGQFSVKDLIRNFEQVALFDEFKVTRDRFVQSGEPARLRRWTSPVRVGIVFGPSVPAAQRRKDAADVRRYTKRLADLTGLDMRPDPGGDIGNFTVMFLNRAEQRAFGQNLQDRQLAEPAVIDAFRNSPPEAFCVAYTFANAKNPDSFGAALILVKAEHRGLMRLSCVHEEMAQAMGLPNDSFKARPSIFNDDEEFALLTKHDEILMRMLYDPRLKPGMSADDARPLLPAIAVDAVRAAGAEALIAASG